MELNKSEFEKAIAGRRHWAVERLSTWVSQGSVLGHEGPAQQVTASLYDELGYETHIEHIDVDKIAKLPGFSPVDWSYRDRPNVVGVHRVASNKGRSLILQGHVDVVSPEPVALWKSPPFEPRIEENGEDGETWMYGRGAGDMKGGSMCYLWALAALRDMGIEPASEVILQTPIEEECTGNGALALCANGWSADACLIPEPFNRTILRSQVGVMWFQVRVIGKTTHVLGAGRGVNAIEKSWVYIQAMRELELELNRPENIPESFRHVPHPINLNVGIINGGDWASTVAGECVTRFRLGLFPGEKMDDLKAKIEAAVARATQADPWLREFPPVVEYIGFQAEGSVFDTNSVFGQVLNESHREWNGADAETLDVTCTTDMRFYNNYYNIPATCYGPKAVNIHGVDERVSIDSMQRVAEVMGTFISRWCGIQRSTSR